MSPPSLFPHLGRIPDRHFIWLCQANTGFSDYQDSWFATKARICHRHGLPDGRDLQTIHDDCPCCYKGIWHPGQLNEDICHRCEGTGIYRVRHVVLLRWEINGLVFHEPDRWDGEAPARDFDRWPRGQRKAYLAEVAWYAADHGYKAHFNGIKVRHGNTRQARVSALKLIRLYWPERFRVLFACFGGPARSGAEWIYNFAGNSFFWSMPSKTNVNPEDWQ